MAEGQTHASMTPDEIQAFTQKLEAWSQGLTPKEQEFLIEILGRAASTEDVAGHAAYLKYDTAFYKAVFIPVLNQIGGEIRQKYDFVANKKV